MASTDQIIGAMTRRVGTSLDRIYVQYMEVPMIYIRCSSGNLGVRKNQRARLFIKPNVVLAVLIAFLSILLVQCNTDRWSNVRQRYPSFQVLPRIPGYGYGQPRWSPDGTQIVFLGAPGISIINRGGTQERSVTDRSLYAVSPDWSPDGSRIAFASRNNDKWDIYTMNVDGSNIMQLTYLEHAGAPKWSPDGERIAFNYKPAEKEDWGIYLMNTDGTNIIRLTHYPLVIGTFEWAPDSMSIVFSAVDESPIGQANLGKSHRVYHVKADGTDLRLLTKDKDGTLSLMWSPDGQAILFLSQASPVGFYLIGADGSGLRMVLDGLFCFDPSWSRKNNHLVCACMETPQVSRLCTVDMKDALK